MYLLFLILGYFLPFLPPWLARKIKMRKKMKKTPGDVVILHKCTKHYDHMLYCSWDMARDGYSCYFSFWAIFCPFTPITAQKIKILKKWKKYLEVSSFYTCAPKIMIRWRTVLKIWCGTDERTDGRKKWHVEVGAPPKNYSCNWKT